MISRCPPPTAPPGAPHPEEEVCAQAETADALEPFSVPAVEQEGSTGIPAEGGTEPQVATPQAIARRPASTGHVPVDASPLGPLLSPPSRPEVAENVWSWQPLSTATTVSVVAVGEEVVEGLTVRSAAPRDVEGEARDASCPAN